MSDIVQTALEHTAAIERAKIIVGELGATINRASAELGQRIGTDILVNFIAGAIIDCKMDPDKFFAAIRGAMDEFRKDEN